MNFLPLFRPLVREENDIEAVVRILEKQQAILKKYNIVEEKELENTDVQYETMQRLEKEVATEMDKTVDSREQLQMLCYDLIDLLKKRYDPKGKAEWRWKAEREMKRSEDSAAAEIPLPIQCKRSVSTSTVRKRKLPLDTEHLPEPRPKRPSSIGNVPRECDSANGPKLKEGNGESMGLSVSKPKHMSVTEANGSKNVSGVLSCTASTGETQGNTLGRNSALQRLESAEQLQTSDMRLDPGTHETDRSFIASNEDFRICEAVLGLTAL